MRTPLKTTIITFFTILMIMPSLAFPYKKVKCFVIEPPEQILPGVKRIAVLDFETEGAKEAKTDNKVAAEKFALKVLSKMLKEDTEDKAETEINYGKYFSNYLISKLIETDRGIRDIDTGFLGLGESKEGKSLQQGTFTNVYEIVERSQMMKVLKEQELSVSGLVADDQVVQLGNMLGVQAIVTGDVNYFQMEEEYTETRTDKKKKTSKKVKCNKRKINLAVRARIISAETGQILGSTEAKHDEQKSKCADSWGSLPTFGEMIDAGLKKLSGQIANYVAPRYKLESYELEKIKGDYKKTGEKAAKLAEDLKIDEAFLLYKSIYEKDSYNPEVLFNLGVMHEVVGNYQKADKFYAMALQLDDKDDYRKAVKRVEKNMAFGQELAKIGIEIEEHSFEQAAAEKSHVLARKVETKGNRSDRVKVHEKPMITSDVVEEVPGSLTFTVIEQEGDWYLIQLLGQKQGYIHKDKVDLK